MATFNEILEGQYSRLLQKKFGMGQAHPPSPQLSPEIVPTFELGQLDISDDALLGWKHYFGALSLPGSANIQQIVLQLPAQVDAKGVVFAQQTIAVIERWIAFIVGTAVEFSLELRYNATNQAPTSTRVGASRDFRLSSPGGNRLTSVAKLASSNNGAFGSSQGFLPMDFATGAASVFHVIGSKADEQVLVSGNQANGEGFGVNTTAANAESINCLVWWREKVINSYELTV